MLSNYYETKMSVRLTTHFRWLLCILLLAVPRAGEAQQIETFVIEDIRIEGIRRSSPGVIFNQLSVGIGDTFSAEQAVEIIGVLYGTGYFREVDVLRDGNVLVVRVDENPTIAEVTVNGVAELAEERLSEMLNNAGIAKAKVFNRSVLEEAKRVLEDIYIERNFYHVKVEAVVSPLPRNRVAILLNVEEGEEAAIRSVRIVGNEAFSTWRLESDMRLEARSFFNFFTDNYHYSEQKLKADLERIRTRYLEAGYLRFEVESWHVEVSPDKRHIDIAIHLNEGRQYKVSGTRFKVAEGAAALPFDLLVLNQYIIQQPGEIYDGQLAGEATEKIREHLGDLGYAGARVRQGAEIDDDSASAEIIYVIDAQKIVYVRHINIVGNAFTDDKVIRRELLQFENERYSHRKIERSRSRIRRLGYFNRVQIEIVPVEGNNEQVDLQVSVEEVNTGKVRFGASFDSDGGLSYNAGFSNSNIFGSGNDFKIDFIKRDDSVVFELEFDEHYHTKDGVTRHIALNYSEEESDSDSSDYDTDGYKGEYGYDYPFTDDGIYNVYLAYERINVKNTENIEEYQKFIDVHGDSSDALLIESGLIYDTRDAANAPTDGERINLRSELGLPVLELQYFAINYLHDYYRTINVLPTSPVMHLRLGAGYGAGYNGGEYPFYQRFYIGGANSLRGFETNSVGYTVDDAGETIGGRSRLYGTFEFSADAKFFENQQVFFVSFIDAGAVGEDIGLGSVRSSLGAELRWLSPVGPLRFSYSTDLRSKPTDDLETFQFSISTF